MKILGIDYGRAKVGLAIAEGGFASPLSVAKVKSWEDAVRKVEDVVTVENVENVVVGVAEGKMAKEQEKFAQTLAIALSVPVDIQDETLSTQDAQEMAISGGVPQKKRRKLEDAYAATIMLQSWLDKKMTGNK